MSHFSDAKPFRVILIALLLAGATGLIATWLDVPQTLSLLLVALAALAPQLVFAFNARIVNKRSQLEAFVQRILDIIPEPVYIKDAESRYLMVNQAFAQQLRRLPEEIIGRTPSEIFESEAYGKFVREEDLRILAGEHIRKEEHGPNPVTGEERFQLVGKEHCLDADGRPVIIGSNLNITRWRVAERELQEAIEREREQRKRTLDFIQRLIDVMPEPIYIKDADSRFVAVNKAFADERQRPANEIIGITSFDLAPNPDTARMVADEDQEILRTGSRIFKEYHALTPVTGEERFRHVHKRLCVDADGRPIIVGAHFDITDLRLAERTLQAALARETALRERVQTYMQRVIDVIPQPVYIKDAQSRYIMVNDAFVEDRGRPREVIIGDSSIHPTNVRPRNEEVAREIESLVSREDGEVLDGAVVLKEESRPHPETGEPRYRLISKRSCFDAEGNPVIVGTNFNITQWRLAEARAERANQAKSIFLASMSHEIRTPLSGVIGTLRLALHDRSLSRETRDYLNGSLSNAESLLSIINDILDFSKIEAGQLKLESIDFNLHTVARDCVQIFKASAATRSLKFDLQIAPDVPAFLRGDPTRIRQVLSNLVGNAIKFTERGSVTVHIERHGLKEGKHHLLFSVKDTGIGIPEEVLPRLFQKFQQADASTTRRYGGTGLGLAICRQLVEAMGGQISVSSEAGQGTTFRFDLSLADGAVVKEESQQALVAHSRKLRVLCAEDVPVNQLIVRTQLKHMGHEVDIVENGLAAIKALSERDYDLVLMDGRMPEMDGEVAARAIRKGGLPSCRVRNPKIRIVALTANASEEDRRVYLGAGMDDYITKPVSEAQLHAVITRTIELQDADAPVTDTVNARVQTVLPKIPAHIEALKVAFEAGNFETLIRLINEVIHWAEEIGMDDLQLLASALRDAAASDETAELERLLPRLCNTLSNVVDCFS